MVQDKLVDMIKRGEGFRSYVYIDPLQKSRFTKEQLKWFEDHRDDMNLTVGYGTLMEDIDEEMATAMLQVKLSQKIREVNEALRDIGTHNENVWDCLYLMAYQLGTGKLLQFKKMITAIKKKDYKLAHTEAMDSLWARQTPKRAKETAGLLLA